MRLPPTAKSIAVLDRCKEPGADGEPLYKDVVTALAQAAADGVRAMPRVIGGRYGLASKEFTPGMVKAVFDELAQEPTPKRAVHRRHPRRPHPSVAAVGRGLPHRRCAAAAACRVLGSRRRRHGVGQQELDQDSRRDHRAAGAGLFRLRFEEVRRGDGVAPALRPGDDPLDLSGGGGHGRLRRLPSAGVRRTLRPAGTRRAGRGFSAQHPGAAGSGLGHAAAEDARADSRQAPAAVGDRRLRGRRAKPAWGGASTPSCRPASSPSPASCRRTRRSPRSSTRSTRPTARRAGAWWS